MGESLKEIFKEIENSEMDETEVKKYILKIKRVIGSAYENCKDEQSEEEIIKEYLEEYEKDLSFRGNGMQIFSDILMYNTYKRLLQDYKGNKINFDLVVKEARKQELESNKDKVRSGFNLKECMVSAIRYIIRTKNISKEKDIIRVIQEEKSVLNNKIKEELIHIIEFSVRTLEEYGIIDEYIDSSNEELEELGLKELKYVKRNPIADKQYDEKGKEVKDVEDIGVLDSLSKENLEKYTVEELQLMAAFWESKYFQERLGLSRAMATIKGLDLWNIILTGSTEDINNIEDSKIEKVLKKDTVLTYITKSNPEITEKVKEEYGEFLIRENISSDISLEEEVKALKSEVSNLKEVSKDVTVLGCFILHQLRTKDMKIKKWGTVKNIEEEKNAQDELVIAIENKNFRGPLVVGFVKGVLLNFLGETNIELPEYDKELNPKFADITSKLFLPSNKFWTNVVNKAYKENPQSEILADLSGKKLQKNNNERD